MREIRTSVSGRTLRVRLEMSGEGKRSHADTAEATAPSLDFYRGLAALRDLAEKWTLGY